MFNVQFIHNKKYKLKPLKIQNLDNIIYSIYEVMKNNHSHIALVKLGNDTNSIEGNLTKPKSHLP